MNMCCVAKVICATSFSGKNSVSKNERPITSEFTKTQSITKTNGKCRIILFLPASAPVTLFSSESRPAGPGRSASRAAEVISDRGSLGLGCPVISGARAHSEGHCEQDMVYAAGRRVEGGEDSRR